MPLPTVRPIKERMPRLLEKQVLHEKSGPRAILGAEHRAYDTKKLCRDLPFSSSHAGQRLMGDKGTCPSWPEPPQWQSATMGRATPRGEVLEDEYSRGDTSSQARGRREPGQFRASVAQACAQGGGF